MTRQDPSVARSMGIRAKANNLAKKCGIAPQAALQAYFAERFLARLSQSDLGRNTAIKGGTLMSAMFGIAERTTMDIDATMIGLPGDETSIRNAVERICAVDAGDGIRFSVQDSAPIRKDDDYGGFGFALLGQIGTIRLSIGLDVTVGDAITPAPAPFSFRQILDADGTIQLLAYTTESLLAEKLQTLLKRGAMTTRPRDFYDIHKLETSSRFDKDVFVSAVEATFRNRHSEALLPRRFDILESIRQSAVVKELWRKYQARFSYAAGISLDTALASAKNLFDLLP
ncbi:MAG: nucleotidyl transferase AbiEii/AbiGii toxin family protein [Kiritimatiellae bacterium]|nr:nucleotidyl transferase AbiEii/AbiGii toxin family protein [Kiritimatiellia bacterium]